MATPRPDSPVIGRRSVDGALPGNHARQHGDAIVTPVVSERPGGLRGRRGSHCPARQHREPPRRHRVRLLLPEPPRPRRVQLQLPARRHRVRQLSAQQLSAPFARHSPSARRRFCNKRPLRPASPRPPTGPQRRRTTVFSTGNSIFRAAALSPTWRGSTCAFPDDWAIIFCDIPRVQPRGISRDISDKLKWPAGATHPRRRTVRVAAHRQSGRSGEVRPIR